MIKNESADIKVHHISFYYALLVLVILIWGTTPVLAPYIYRYVSPTLYTLISAFATVAFNYITVNGAPISPVYFEWNLTIIILITAVGLFGVTLCWILRTVVVRHVDASVVAVIMPFSSVIAGTLSVLLGFDKLSITLLVGGVIVLIAAIMSGLGDSNKLRKKR